MRTHWFIAAVAAILYAVTMTVTAPGLAATPYTGQEASGEGAVGVTYRDIASLSDKEIRERYLEDLEQTGAALGRSTESGTKGGLLTLLPKLEAFSSIFYWRLTILKYNYAKLPHDLGQAVGYLTEGKGTARLLVLLVSILGLLAAGFVVEGLIRRTASTKGKIDIPAERPVGSALILNALLKVLPDLVGLLIFMIIAFVLFVIFFGTDASGLRPLFFTALATVFIARLVSIISRMVVSPKVPVLRLVPVFLPSPVRDETTIH